jgi:hypothetical protein
MGREKLAANLVIEMIVLLAVLPRLLSECSHWNAGKLGVYRDVLALAD